MKKNYMIGMTPKVDALRLARAYVPFQVMDKIFEPWKALMRGTIFPELYDPYPKKKRSGED